MRQSAAASSADAVECAGRPRVGQVVRQVEQRLLAVVVRRADRQLVGLAQAEPVADEPELAARGQRGRDENRRRVAAPEQLGQRAADVHRRPREQVGLGPDDAVAVVGLEAGVDVGGQAQRPGGDRVDLVLLPGQGCGELAEPDGERLGRLGRDLAKTPPARLGRDLREQPPARGVHPVDRARRHRDRRLAAGPVDVAEQTVDDRAADPAAEPRRRRLLETMGLVEDHRVVLGQHRRRVGAARRPRSAK